MNTLRKLVFVDLEATGANPVNDRITEIGIVCVEDGRVSQWSSLVNPQTPIPPFIQNLTGISDAMVSDAPVFELLAEKLLAQFNGALFIAHNARFDHGFLKNSFKRIGISFQCEVLCTVKLSRKLYPEEIKHSLGSLIERHQLVAEARHRALADADVLWQFWQKLQRDIPADLFEKALSSLRCQSNSLARLAPDFLEEMPNTCGVYVFYDENDVPLFVSKSAHMRRHAQTHFDNERNHPKNASFTQLVARVEWYENVGEVGAALLESKLFKDLQPHHNRILRESGLCSWQLRPEQSGTSAPILLQAADQDFGCAENLYGLFRSRKKAEGQLRELAVDSRLCLVTMGLENRASPTESCKAYQSNHCAGACIGLESLAMHQARMAAALSNLHVQSWPYAGAVGLIEVSADGQRQDFHGANNWCYLGSAKTAEDMQKLLLNTTSKAAAFDVDCYKILSRALIQGSLKVMQ